MITLFYLCPICGNLITKIENGGPIPHCCGQEMTQLHPGTVEASAEKHIPVIEKINDDSFLVKVGSTPHPMTQEHHINWIWIKTSCGARLHYLSPDDKADVKFHGRISDVEAVYAYCNIHGLWKCE